MTTKACSYGKPLSSDELCFLQEHPHEGKPPYLLLPEGYAVLAGSTCRVIPRLFLKTVNWQIVPRNIELFTELAVLLGGDNDKPSVIQRMGNDIVSSIILLASFLGKLDGLVVEPIRIGCDAVGCEPLEDIHTKMTQWLVQLNYTDSC